MKKKMISILLSGLTVLSLSACNIEKVDQGVTDSRDTSTVNEQNSSEATKESVQESESETNEESKPDESTEQGTDDNGNSISGNAELSGEEFMLSRWYGSDEPVYVINANGDLQSKFSMEELKEKLGNKISDFDSVSPRFIDDNILYFSAYEYPNDKYVNYVSAIDLNTYEIQRLWSSDDFVYLRVTKSDENGLKTSIEEVVLTKKRDSLEFTQEVHSYDNITKVTEDMYVNTMDREDRNDYSATALSICFEKCGYVVAVSNDTIYMIDADANVKEIKNPTEDYINVNDFDKDYIVYTSRNETSQYMNCYDVNSGETRKLMETSDSYGYLGYENGNLYFCEDRSLEYGVQDEAIYQYNLKSDTSRRLYEFKDTPGIDIMAGTEGWRMIGDSIYFIAPSQDKLNWIKVDVSADLPKLTDTGYMVSEINTFKYGTVTYASTEVKCADCGTVVEKDYGETFVLDGQYSANADKINESLKAYLVDDILSKEKVVKVNSDICEEHQNTDYDINPYLETYEHSIFGVDILSDKYLAVEVTGYWYGGGAHGMPTRGQYIYDLETGKEMQLKDFYQGTEKDFKELVAKKTKEDFESYTNGYPPYFAETAEDVYQQAKDLADLTITMVEFTEDKAYIVFPPYEMGPYASGYIEVPISYEELLGRSSL